MNEVTLNGSCLCGAVRYEVVGDLQRFYHCHCSRCRKSSGTGHATNLMLANARILFSHGEALLKRYKVPDAERFTRQFCSECVVPAGSLDCPVPIQPQARVFWDSRAEWSCGDQELPRFTEYPPA